MKIVVVIVQRFIPRQENAKHNLLKKHFSSTYKHFFPSSRDKQVCQDRLHLFCQCTFLVFRCGKNPPYMPCWTWYSCDFLLRQETIWWEKNNVNSKKKKRSAPCLLINNPKPPHCQREIHVPHTLIHVTDGGTSWVRHLPRLHRQTLAQTPVLNLRFSLI